MVYPYPIKIGQVSHSLTVTDMSERDRPVCEMEYMVLEDRCFRLYFDYPRPSSTSVISEGYRQR